MLMACPSPETPHVPTVDAGEAVSPSVPESSSPTSASSAPPAAGSDAGAGTGTITMDDDVGCTKIAAAFEQKARPKIKECYREGKKTNSALEGGIRIQISVDGLGKLGTPKAQDVTLPDAVAKCMVKAVQDTPFEDASKCKRKGITLPIQFPSK